jgi:hypothetical protein
MKKLMLSVLAVAALSTGAALAQDGGAEAQAGSAWRQQPNYGPVPGTPEYYGNSGVSPELVYPYGYAYGYNRAYPPQAAPAYPYVPPERARRQRDRDWDGVRNSRDRDRDGVRNARDRDRDGDGVRNARDRYPDDARRW